jgi:hypothetical protein
MGKHAIYISNILDEYSFSQKPLLEQSAILSKNMFVSFHTLNGTLALDLTNADHSCHRVIKEGLLSPVLVKRGCNPNLAKRLNLLNASAIV